MRNTVEHLKVLASYKVSRSACGGVRHIYILPRESIRIIVGSDRDKHLHAHSGQLISGQ